MTLIAILVVTCGALASLGLFTLILAGSPNSTPEMWARLKMYMLLTVIGGVSVLASAIWAIATGKPGIGAIVGGTPAVVLFGLIVWATARGN